MNIGDRQEPKTSKHRPAKVLRAEPQTVHWGYLSKDLRPVLSVADGDELEVHSLSYPRGENVPELLTPELEDILRSVTDGGPGPHLLTGPVYVSGAKPGDVLAIDILSVSPSLDYAYNRFLPGERGLGLLPEDFPVGRLKLLRQDRQRKEVVFSDTVRIPMRCFFGIMAVAPPHEGRWTSRIPGAFGGNLDITDLTAGSTLYLPVFHDGALFSVGDGHAVQGDGEINIAAAETSMTGRFRLSVRRDWSLARPMAETATRIITVGIHEDVREAAKIASRDMIAWLEKTKGMPREEGYMLCSLALDLKISQLVNGQNGVHALLPKGIFES